MRTLLLLIAIAIPLIGCAEDAPATLQYESVIDAHAHIGEFRGYNLSLENLLLNMKENGIQYAAISNIDGADVEGFTADKSEMEVNAETERVASEHTELIPVAWAKPGAKGASAGNIEHFLRDSHFAAIKFHPEFNHFDAEGPEVLPYLRLCERYGVPALFHCGASARSGPRVIYRVAKKFPRVPFVLYHMGFGTSHEDAIEVARLAKEHGDAILYLESAQVHGPELVKAVKAVGADRVIFGTDATYYGRYHYAHYAGALDLLRRELSPEDFRKIIHDNAAALFHLK